MSVHCTCARRPFWRAAPRHVDIVVALGTVALAAIAMATSGLADESYVCDDGRIVTVRFGELEKLSRTDDCIAKHLARRGAAALQPVAQPLPLPPTAAVDVPLPVRKPAIAIAAAGAAAATAAAAAADAADRLATHAAGTEVIVHHEAPPQAGVVDGTLRPRVEQVQFRHAPHHFYSTEELPKGPADFRRVPIINAAPGEPAVFLHAR